MKQFSKIFLAAALALTALCGGLFTACEDKPIDVIVTDYGYSVTLDDIHMAEGVYPECVIRLTNGGGREESVKVKYLIDDDASLRVKVNGQEVGSGSDVTFDLSGVMRITLPSLPEGQHKLHLVLTNQYGKSFEKDIFFNVIRDKVWATAVTAPASVRVERGSVKDTTVAIVPSDADILVLSVASSDSSVVTGRVMGDGAEKTLRVEPVADGTARLFVRHADLKDPATVSVEVFSYKISGLSDITVEEGKDMTFTLTVEPEHDVTLSSSNANATVQDMGNKTFKVTGITPGSAILTAVAGNTRQESVVTVRKKEETIAVSPMSATIAYGATKMFSVASSADYRAELSNDNASVVEMTTSGVSVKNENRSFTDGEVTLTVVNRADENKKATASIVLEKKPETISLSESSSSEGRTVLAVGGENGGWELVSAPNGLRASIDDGDIILVNDTYKTVTGKVSVKTRTQGVTASKEVSVQGLEVTLQSLRMEPSEFSLEVGRSMSVSVVGRYVDGSEKDVTGSVTWTQSSNLQRSSNNFTATAIGSAWIRASLDSKTVQADGNITMTVTELNIDPTFFNALVGDSKLFTVTAKYSNNSSKDVTRECRYVITGGAKEAAKGYITMTEPGEVLVEAIYTYDGVESYATARGTVTKPVANVTRVEITPLSSQIKVGESVTFTGTVYYSDGSSDHTSGSWSVSDQSVLSGGSGTYVALKEGSATVMYSCSQYSATASVTVKGGGGTGGGDLTGIALSKTRFELAPGQVDQVSVVAHYSDGSVKEVTRETSWSSVNTSVAEVDRNGYVVARGEGETYITAEWSTQVAQLYVVVKTPVTLRSLEASPSSLSFSLYGSAQQVSLTALYSDGSTEVVTGNATWTSSNAQVATVQAGLVTPIKEGTCNIGASFGGKNISIPVTVGPAEIGSIEIMPSGRRDYTCTVGDSYELECIGRYKGAEMSITYLTWTANWSASPSGVVRLEDGASKKRVVAIGPGDAVISVEYQGLRDAVSVHVKAAAPTITGIRLSPTSINMTPGGTYSLSNIDVRYIMSDGSAGSSANVSWSLPSSASSYATLSGTTLKIKEGVSNGATFTLEARTNDYQYKANLTVTISAADWAFDRLETNSSACVIVIVGSTVTITDQVNIYAVYKDKNGRESEKSEKVSDKVTWTPLCKNGEFTVSGNQLTGIKKCDASANTGVRALYRSGNNEGSVNVPVQVSENPNVVTGVSLNKKELSLSVGQSETLTATVQPSNATNKKVYWSSGNSSIATVSDGTVTAKAVGNTTIVATTADGGYAAECRVEVTAAVYPVTGVRIYDGSSDVTGTKVRIPTGVYKQFTAKISPDNATNKKVTWRSSNDNIAEVDNEGRVYLSKQQTATITVTTEDGNKTASVTVEGYQESYLIGANPASLEWDYNDKASKTISMTMTNVKSVQHTYKNSTFLVSIDNQNKKVSITPQNKDAAKEVKETFQLKDENGHAAAETITLVWKAKPTNYLDKIELYNTSSSSSLPGYSGSLNFKAVPRDNEGAEMNDVTTELVCDKDGYLDISKGSSANTFVIKPKQNPASSVKVNVYAKSGSVQSNSIAITIEHEKVYPTAINLTPKNVSINVNEGFSNWNVTFTPEATTEKTLIWSSEDPNYISVNSVTGAIVGVKSTDGKAKMITVSAANAKGGNISSSAGVTVTEAEKPVSKIECDLTTITFTGSDDNKTKKVLHVYVYPYNATNVDLSISGNTYANIVKNRQTKDVANGRVDYEYYVNWTDFNSFTSETVQFTSVSNPSIFGKCNISRESSSSLTCSLSGKTSYELTPNEATDLVSTQISTKTASASAYTTGISQYTRIVENGGYLQAEVEVTSSNSTVASVDLIDGHWILTAHELGSARLSVNVVLAQNKYSAGTISVTVRSDEVVLSGLSTKLTKANVGSTVTVCPLTATYSDGSSEPWDESAANQKGVKVELDGKMYSPRFTIPTDIVPSGMNSMNFKCSLKIGNKTYGTFNLKITNN